MRGFPHHFQQNKCTEEDRTDTGNVEPEIVLEDRQFAEAVQESSHKQGNNKTDAATLNRSEIEDDYK